MNKLLGSALILGLVCSSAAFSAGMEQTKMVGGAEMYPSKNIIENATQSKDHTTLVAAVKVAGLVGTLEGKGPFTVFAPTNEAFNKLPAGTVDSLLKPENKGKLTSVLTYHVVAGKLDMKALMSKVQAGGGKAKLMTVNGEPLWVIKNGAHSLQLKDKQGNIANVSIWDVHQSNGVIDVIDTVLMP
ncbi:fasciclin domain-containing protein [Yokenella regensburgei]|uniref:fasciclin domain-containing protein n=1 Tax=Yokenella regensburgei TaxID=158877 RepID=UPI003ED8B80A